MQFCNYSVKIINTIHKNPCYLYRKNHLSLGGLKILLHLHGIFREKMKNSVLFIISIIILAGGNEPE